MAQQKGKKVVVRRRRERKNIENGAVHIQSTFNNTIVTITDTQATPFLGQALADWASAAPESLLRSLHRQLLKPQQRQQWNTV